MGRVEGEGAGIVALYPTGLAREPAGTVTPGSATVSSSMGPTNSVAIAGGGRRLVFLGGFTDTAATVTPPAGFSNQHLAVNGAVTAVFSERQYGAAATVPGQTTVLSALRGWVAGMVAIS